MILKEIYSDSNRSYNELIGKLKPVITLEVYPPRDDFDDKKVDDLICELKVLKKFNPALVSVTYGAGGGSKDGSINLAKRIKEEAKLDLLPHFTCICSNKASVDEYLAEIQAMGAENILALRGDEPQNIGICYRDFLYANELVKYIKSKTNLSVAVAGYPEGHPKSPDLLSDIDNLKKKVDAGAEVIYTQLFFDNDYFFKYKQLVRDAGINLPIVAGILPVLNFNQLESMVKMCKVDVPKDLAMQLEKYGHDSKATMELGIEYACSQCQELIDNDVEGLHFYMLNKSYSVNEILDTLF